MTMTAEQLAQLREVAERATPGDWRRASTRFNGITATPFTLGGEEVMLASASEKRDAEFIAAFHPAIALALLDEQERKDKRIAKLEARTVTVKLPTAYDLTGETDGNCYLNDASMQPDIDGCYFSRRDVESACAAAGINLTVEG